MTPFVHMKRLVAATAFAVGVVALGPAFAQADPSAAIRKSVESWLNNRYQVDELRRTPLDGIWEVRIGHDLIYVDDKGHYAFIEGQMVDLKTGRSLTQERVEQLQTIDFKALPLDLAIKQVNGKGTRVLAVFEDPNCGYCRTMRRDLDKLTDVTIYTFPYAILSPDSEAKAKAAWCAPDRATAWNEMMIKGKAPAGDGNCDNPIAKVQELGRKLRITGTPTVFFANGKRVPGAVPLARLNQLLAENSGK